MTEPTSLEDFCAEVDVQIVLKVAGQAVEFSYDVPVAGGGMQGFGTFAVRALGSAAGLNSRLVDDNGKPVDAVALLRIREQVRAIHDSMADCGLYVGAPATVALFKAQREVIALKAELARIKAEAR